MLEKNSHILISQLKNVGDVVLALPVASLIRQHYPEAIISFIGLSYVQPVVDMCPDINHFINWDVFHKLSDGDAVKELNAHNITAIVHLSDDNWLAKIAKKAGIPYRIGTIQQLPNLIYCNRWVNQGRRHSHLHETESNARMLKPLGIPKYSLSFSELIPHVHLEPKNPLPSHLENLLSNDRFNLILHPGSHGHGREWPMRFFTELIETLSHDRVQIFLTGSLKEKERFAELIALPHTVNLMGETTLEELITFIQKADGLIASGTGPVHLAAGLGIKTLGLFPPRQGISPRRWHPTGRQASVLVYDRPAFKFCLSCRGKSECFCMTQISVEQVFNVVKKWTEQ